MTSAAVSDAAVALVTAFGVLLVVYLAVRLATAAYYKSRNQFNK